MARPSGPLLVFGPRSLTYDLGPGHPLTPRRFGPGIDLLRAVGAEPGLAPEPASDEELLWIHEPAYVEIVRRFGEDPDRPGAAGIGPGDTPAFPGMHEASAAVAGGSLRAMEAILAGEVEHAFHPGGGLHHAMPGRASGFCVYNDPALAIAMARRAGLRVLYVDLDVHHGDGVEAVHLADPGVLTVSIHESGRYLFPGTGFPGDHGSGAAAGTAINVPLVPGTAGATWVETVRLIVPAVAAAFAPDVVVSQHGADSHALDPLAHLRVTTTAMGETARLVDRITHRWAAGRWLATGGGGYDAYRVVPRSWGLVWLAGAHREPPGRIPEAWRERWAAEAARYGQSPLPHTFDDPSTLDRDGSQAANEASATSLATARLVRSVLVPRLIREAEERGWWSPLDEAGGVAGAAPPRSSSGAAGPARSFPPDTEPAIVPVLEPAVLDRLRIPPRVVAPPDPEAAMALLRGALSAEQASLVTAAIAGDAIVALAVSAPTEAGTSTASGRASGGLELLALGVAPGGLELLALGVAPGFRRRGLGTALLRAHVDAARDARRVSVATLVTVAERDPVEPLPLETRAAIARTLLARSGFGAAKVPEAVAAVDASAVAGVIRLDA